MATALKNTPTYLSLLQTSRVELTCQCLDKNNEIIDKFAQEVRGIQFVLTEALFRRSVHHSNICQKLEWPVQQGNPNIACWMVEAGYNIDSKDR
jgi:hypothetical protein